MIIQLDPMIPVVIIKDKSKPEKGFALGWIDYSQEHHLLWIVSINKSGEVWIVPNCDIRLEKNYSMDRNLEEIKN